MKSEIVDVDEIQELIISYANGDFSKRIPIDIVRDARDSIITGINMLGEELETTTISKDYFESIYDAVTEYLIVTDKDFCIKDINLAAQEKLAKSKAELLGTDARKLLNSEPKLLQEPVVKNNGRTSYSFETNVVLENGELVILRCTLSDIISRNTNEEGYLIIASDVTKQRQQEKEILKLIVGAQEEERKRLSYDLHDSLGQELNAIHMYISSLDYMDKNDENFLSALKTCKTMIEHSVSGIQSLAFDLMPKSLENANLSYALIELCSKIEKVGKVKHNFEYEPLPLSKYSQKVIYRIFQEFINNSLKHAKGATINLCLFRANNMLKFILEDDGPGFDFETLVRKNGVQNIKSRLEALNVVYIFTGDNGARLEFAIAYEEN